MASMPWMIETEQTEVLLGLQVVPSDHEGMTGAIHTPVAAKAFECSKHVTRDDWSTGVGVTRATEYNRHLEIVGGTES